MAFQYAPRESTMGDVQRIFYFHVPFALGSFMAFGVVMVASVGYLMKRELSWDRAAHAAVEVGFLYTTLVLLTGPVWAKAAWGVWWTWDARLTSTLMLWLIFASYLFLRTYMADDPRLLGGSRRSSASWGHSTFRSSTIPPSGSTCTTRSRPCCARAVSTRTWRFRSGSDARDHLAHGLALQ
ncbi:MAG: cytochrome c biogenesis protein CcsA [Candidatus Eisenbacteria bacterium]